MEYFFFWSVLVTPQGEVPLTLRQRALETKRRCVPVGDPSRPAAVRGTECAADVIWAMEGLGNLFFSILN